MGGDCHGHRPAVPYPQLSVRPKGKHIESIARDRLKQFTDNGQYKQQNLMGKLYHDRVADSSPYVSLKVWDAHNLSRPTFSEATRKENVYRPITKGHMFGPSWSSHWVLVSFKVPSQWTTNADAAIELHWDASCEGMVWTTDGKPLQGLTGNNERVEWIIPADYRTPDKTHSIYIEVACNGMFGAAPGGDTIQPPVEDKYFQLQTAELVLVNKDARALYYDFWIIGDAAREFPSDSWEQHRALQVGIDIMDCFIAGDGSDEALKQCRIIAKQYLGNDIDSEKVYEQGNGSGENGDDDSPAALIDGIGHCHIDTCWLWPWAETKRKVARSWSNQCDLLDRYPEHRFCASQAQQYKWLEQHYPYVFDRVKAHVKKGNFHPIGGSWVEHDTNLPSGESLVRQFLYGQRFFESRFGQRSRTFWLPDTFGYSSQIPQLCRLAGMERFFTQKLSWNNINNFPHTTFNWVSIDGSQVLCHMAPSETYTAEAHFGDVQRSVTQHKSMDQDPSSLLVFGKGDGGGGPTWEHIEKLRRCRGMNNTIGRLPRVQMGRSVDDFFDRLQARSHRGPMSEFTTWYGELYFELHRGTYTTQANNKLNNRRAEFLLRDIEYLATLATIQSSRAKSVRDGQPVKKYAYPKKDIDAMWENVLLCQFHDCLPGSSIEMCYDDSDKLYDVVFETGQRLLNDALVALGFCHPDEDHNQAANRVALNVFGWTRNPEHPSTKVLGERDLFASVVYDNQFGLPKPKHDPLAANVQKNPDGSFTLMNDAFRVTVSDGVITSLFDMSNNRELVPEGSKANQYVIFDDKPLYWQAWDVEVFHLNSRKELQAVKGSTKITSCLPERVSVTTRTRISDQSSIWTTISLPRRGGQGETPAVEVEAVVEWHETMKFLKVEFPTTITNTEASYETQFGIIRRPTHYNTSWDMAKFEVCCHKWADLSEYGYGISILNDSKYGFATCGNLMRLSLLRAPKAPDAHADMGSHVIRWAIMPHAGPLDHRTVRAGYNFNSPMRVHSHPNPKDLDDLMAAFKLDPARSTPGLIVDTVKRGEDDADASSGDFPANSAPAGARHVILRVFDSLGGRGRGYINFGDIPVGKVWKSNLLEDNLEQCSHDDKGFEFELRAFEVATFKFLLGDA